MKKGSFYIWFINKIVSWDNWKVLLTIIWNIPDVTLDF